MSVLETEVSACKSRKKKLKKKGTNFRCPYKKGVSNERVDLIVS